MSATKNSPAFDRMMEENRERERMEFLEREYDFLSLLGVPASKAKRSGFPLQSPHRNAEDLRSNPSRK